MNWTDRLFDLLLSEEDLTSKNARKAATKAAVHMDVGHEDNVKKEMAKETIRTGKDANRTKAIETAIKNDPKMPASARRAVDAKSRLRKMLRGATVTPAARGDARHKQPGSMELLPKSQTHDGRHVPNIKGAQKKGTSFVKKNNPKTVDRFKATVKAAKGDPREKANRTIQRVMDRESRATEVGFGPKSSASTNTMIQKARMSASRPIAIQKRRGEISKLPSKASLFRGDSVPVRRGRR